MVIPVFPPMFADPVSIRFESDPDPGDSDKCTDACCCLILAKDCNAYGYHVRRRKNKGRSEHVVY